MLDLCLRVLTPEQRGRTQALFAAPAFKIVVRAGELALSLARVAPRSVSVQGVSYTYTRGAAHLVRCRRFVVSGLR